MIRPGLVNLTEFLRRAGDLDSRISRDGLDGIRSRHHGPDCRWGYRRTNLTLAEPEIAQAGGHDCRSVACYKLGAQCFARLGRFQVSQMLFVILPFYRI